MTIIEIAFFCYVYSPRFGQPCLLGEWLPATTIVMPGTYDSEDTDMNPPRHRPRPRKVKP